jgi:hypothetical protein
VLPTQAPRDAGASGGPYALDGQGVDVADGPSKMLAVLVLGPKKRLWRVRQVRASVVEKL